MCVLRGDFLSCRRLRPGRFFPWLPVLNHQRLPESSFRCPTVRRDSPPIVRFAQFPFRALTPGLQWLSHYSPEGGRERCLPAGISIVDTCLKLKPYVYHPIHLLPLNSRAAFQPMKTMGYRRVQKVCNSLVNKLIHPASFSHNFYPSLSVT